MPEHRKKGLSEGVLEVIAQRFKTFSGLMRPKLVYTPMDGEKTVSELVREAPGACKRTPPSTWAYCSTPGWSGAASRGSTLTTG